MNDRSLTHIRVRPGIAGILAILMAASLLWAYWPTLLEMEQRWSHDPRYSHGYLVPPFALYLLWSRRERRRSDRARFRWVGVLLIAAGAALRLIGDYGYFAWLDAASLLTSLTGVCWLLGGRDAVRWAWPSIAFLIFMVPLPYRAEVALSHPLQRVATEISTYALQVFGLPAFSSGNTIMINDFTLGIVDACNGLGTAYMFLACAVAAAFMVPRPALDRIVLISSAIPIAIIANVMRIVATGLLHELMGSRVSGAVYHDLAGWLMMMVTLLILYLECRLLPHLFIDGAETDPIAVEPIEDNPIKMEQSDVRAKPSRGVPILVAIAIIVSTGYTHGGWINRWALSRELDLAISRLDRVPMTIGGWTGRTQEVDPRAMIGAGLDGSLMRFYDNSRTGRRVGLLLVCGRPGPVSVHTPDICYPEAGYEMTRRQPAKFPAHPDPRSAPVEFLQADFDQEISFPPKHLRIYWTWNAKGIWSVPENPRLAFASRDYLYKLYVFYERLGDVERSEDDSFGEFLGQLMPELDKALFPSDPASG